MKCFQKNHKREPAKHPSLIEGIEKMQRQLADWLSRQSEKFSMATKKVLLLSFGMVMGGMSISLLIEPFGHEKVNGYFTMPDHIEPPVIAPSGDGSLTQQQQVNVLTEVLNSLDSLKELDPDTYDQIIKRKETLVDSIRLLLRWND